MSSSDLDDALRTASTRVRDMLLAERGPDGHWVGELSTSALSTATASFALTLVDRAGTGPGPGEGSPHEGLILGGLSWLAENVNSDGGWGDTIRSRSNISTTTLCWAALHAVPQYRARFGAVLESADDWIVRHAGSTDAESLTRAIVQAYGEDRTFSVPILTMCQLADRLGERGWDRVLQLPLELAALPRGLFRFLRLRVVSYALPALIAIGLVRHHHRPSRNILLRGIRAGLRSKTLRVLSGIQPSSGGFLEAIPLTSFVTMSLAASGHADHEVVRKAVRFLQGSVRSDGSWPIDTDLATWVTTLSIDALSEGDTKLEALGEEGRSRVLDWLLGQQVRDVHPYTDAAPGGWAWTDLPGGVPDADDTSGALIALLHLDGVASRPGVDDAAVRGLTWLLDLQNRDGGIPTFCRGWGKLPFDRSGADITAHALKAFAAWQARVDGFDRVLSDRVERAAGRAADFLKRAQRADGSWSPLWFGNQDASKLENPCYGTSRVLRAIDALPHRWRQAFELEGVERRAVDWLLGSQSAGGGWGGDRGVEPSVEETALAVSALARRNADLREVERSALRRGVQFLVRSVESGSVCDASPMGFYFAKLWYFERLYPLVFALAALGRARGVGGKSLFS